MWSVSVSKIVLLLAQPGRVLNDGDKAMRLLQTALWRVLESIKDDLTRIWSHSATQVIFPMDKESFGL